MRRRFRCAAAVLLVAVVGVGACGDDEDTPASGTGGEVAEHDDHEHAGHGGDKDAAFPLEDADITVKVGMKDFLFAGVPSTVKGEKVLFEITNEGPSDHEFVVFEKGGEDAVRGIGPFTEGKTQMLAVQLKPGSYTAKCLVKRGVQTHADLGMQTDFNVG